MPVQAHTGACTYTALCTQHGHTTPLLLHHTPTCRVLSRPPPQLTLCSPCCAVLGQGQEVAARRLRGSLEPLMVVAARVLGEKAAEQGPMGLHKVHQLDSPELDECTLPLFLSGE